MGNCCNCFIVEFGRKRVDSDPLDGGDLEVYSSYKKNNHVKKVIESENLDAPADSVKFLESMQKHEEKTNHHKKRVHRFSKLLFVIGIAALVFMMYRYFVEEKRIQEY